MLFRSTARANHTGTQGWSTIVSTPTTLAGYGITDAVSSSDSRLTDARTPTAHTQAWTTITATPTTLAGYGITDAVSSTDARLTDARTPLAHNQAWSTITSTPTTLAGYGITDAAAGDHTHSALSPATASTLGTVKIGSGVSVAGDGTISVSAYSLPKIGRAHV